MNRLQKGLTAGALAAALLVAGVSVFAQTNNAGTPGPGGVLSTDPTGQPNSLGTGGGADPVTRGLKLALGIRAASLGRNGNWRIAGPVVSAVNLAGNSITVTYFGFTRDINLDGVKLFGPTPGRNITLADYRVGDSLVGYGTFEESTHKVTIEELYNKTFRRSRQ